MPIYAYRCAACGHSRDVLQKLSDAPLSVCPACGAEQFSKQLTAAGFQLKGSGWYATDFRNNNGAKPAEPASGAPAADAAAAPAAAGGSGEGATKAVTPPAAAPASAPAPAGEPPRKSA